MYQDSVKPLLAEVAQYDEALTNEALFRQAREQLSEKENSFPVDGRERLAKLLPDTVDSVRLIIDIDNLALKYGLRLKNVKVNTGGASQTQDLTNMLGADQGKYSAMSLSFSVTAPYENFVAFVKQLERSLRLMDITSIAFNSSEANLYDYNVTIKTYWLK